MENSDTPLFSLQKANLMNGVTPACNKKIKARPLFITANRKWRDEHDPQSIYRDHIAILNLTETIIYYY